MNFHAKITTLKKIRNLNFRAKIIYFQVAVNSGGKHCLALSADGEVYSWGEGDDGKLGHGNKTSADRPRVIEALRGKDISFIACGGAHSAAITATGNY